MIPRLDERFHADVISKGIEDRLQIEPWLPVVDRPAFAPVDGCGSLSIEPDAKRLEANIDLVLGGWWLLGSGLRW